MLCIENLPFVISSCGSSATHHRANHRCHKFAYMAAFKSSVSRSHQSDKKTTYNSIFIDNFEITHELNWLKWIEHFNRGNNGHWRCRSRFFFGRFEVLLSGLTAHTPFVYPHGVSIYYKCQPQMVIIPSVIKRFMYRDVLQTFKMCMQIWMCRCDHKQLSHFLHAENITLCKFLFYSSENQIDHRPMVLVETSNV